MVDKEFINKRLLLSSFRISETITCIYILQYFLVVYVMSHLYFYQELKTLFINLIFVLQLISGFHRDADEACVLLGYNAAASSNHLPTFRDNVSVPSSRVKKSKKSRLLDP
jgi:hypothetical protein